MRYASVRNISFTTKENNVFELKDMREYPGYSLWFSLKLSSGDFVDEIASREEVYGDEGEMNSFKIVDFNIVNLFEKDFDLDKLKKIDVPL